MGSPYAATGPYITADRSVNYHDLFKSFSVVNRKLFQQGHMVDIANLHIHTKMIQEESQSGTPIHVTVSVLPNTWVVQNAWKKAFALWRKQQAMAYEGSSPSAKPKWQDFKVYFDEDHKLEYDNLIDIPIMAMQPTMDLWSNNPKYNQVEAWDYSNIAYEVDTGTPVGEERSLHMIGLTTAGSFGCVTEYAKSRARVHQTEPALDGSIEDTMYALSEPTNVVVEDLIHNLTVTNESPPYDVDNYPGGGVNGQYPLIVYSGTLSAFVGSQINTGPFQAPLGLVRVDFSCAPVSGELPLIAAAFIGEFNCIGMEAMGQ